MKYRKKPVIIDAIQYLQDVNWKEVKTFAGDCLIPAERPNWAIKTLEGEMLITNGDYVIKGIQGEFYPCKPDIFAKTYEPAE